MVHATAGDAVSARRRAWTLLLGAATLVPATAFAQATAPSGPVEAPTAPGVETAASEPSNPGDIIVTGTAIRGVKPAGSATVVADIAELKGAGLTNPIDLQRVIPQLQTSNFIETSAASNTNSTKGSTFNLRGLGATGTLLLVDGRRVVQNGTSIPYYDANSIPFVAIQRMEVVTDGASAIYGADAVGGVVNIILKKKMKGLDLSARVTDQLGRKTWEFSGGAGATWSIFDGREGSIFVSGSFQTRDNLPRSAGRFLSLDATSLGGNDRRVAGNVVQSNGPGTLAVASTTPGQFLYFALPGTKTSGLTYANLTPGLGNIAKDADNIDYVGLVLQLHL